VGRAQESKERKEYRSKESRKSVRVQGLAVVYRSPTSESSVREFMIWKEFTGVQGVGGVYRSPESGRSVKFQGVGGVTGARGVGVYGT
jgi:hypothetical protein